MKSEVAFELYIHGHATLPGLDDVWQNPPLLAENMQRKTQKNNNNTHRQSWADRRTEKVGQRETDRCNWAEIDGQTQLGRDRWTDAAGQ